MRIRYKEDPREWRKSVLLSALGLAMLSSVLWWRRVLPGTVWLVLLGLLGLMAAVSVLKPRWFRGYYRISMRAGVALSHVVARVALTCIFVLVVTPLGVLLRVAGKDLLRLRRTKSNTYWVDVREPGPLDRLF